jgi:hypothetical protein
VASKKDFFFLNFEVKPKLFFTPKKKLPLDKILWHFCLVIWGSGTKLHTKNLENTI